MASSNPTDGSPQQKNPAEKTSQQKNPTGKTSQIQEITGKLSTLLEILSEARKGAEKDISSQLDKAEKELSYMIGAFKKLVDFENDISESLLTLETNVKDIQADLGRATDESLKQAIERNLKVLRSNLTKVKVLIPLQHQVSVAGSEGRGYNLQTTVASKEVLPNPYEAKRIFESGSFVKEIQDHYEALDIRRKLCLLCFAIFPENAEVKTRLLRFWWLGERLMGKDSVSKDPKEDSVSKDPKEDFVNKTLGEFVKKGFIEPVTKKSKLRATSYKMHPIIRSLIIKLAMEANFFDYDSKGNPTMEISASKKSSLVKSEQGTPSWFSKNFSQSGIQQKPESSDSQQNKNKPEKEEAHQQAENETRGKQKQRLKQGTCCGSSKQCESGTKQQTESSDNQQDKSKPGKEKEHQQAENETRGKQKQRLKQGTCCGSSKQSESGTEQQPESSDNQHQQNRPGKNEEAQQKTSDYQRIKLEKQRQKNLDALQTLFNVSKQFPDLPVELFSKMRNIGVLYLGRWESTAERHIEVENTKFFDGLKTMGKLRFFSLQGISGISKLPKSISKLTNLRILDLRACHNLEKLPKEIGSLKRLTRLDLSECYLLDNISKQLSHLSNLEVLKGFVISENSSCKVWDLVALHKLKKLSINVNSDKFDIDEVGNVFFKLTALQKLKIAWGAGGEGASKSANGNKVNNGTKSKQKNKDEKKGHGNPMSSEDRQKKESDESAKSRGKSALQKLWGSCGEGSSKSIAPENQGTNRDAKKQGSDAQKPMATISVINLVKLDLECFPRRDPPKWLVPEKLTGLKHLYIRGGILSNLGKTESSMPANKMWKEVETLHLKFLTDMKTNWKELQTHFPKLKHLEKVKCPQITFCPCDANGVWKSKQP